MLYEVITSSPFKALFNGVPDTTNLDAYLQASVFTGMEKLTDNDKVVVVWGEEDSTVPVWQSTKYVDYAKELGVITSYSIHYTKLYDIFKNMERRKLAIIILSISFILVIQIIIISNWLEKARVV